MSNKTEEKIPKAYYYSVDGVLDEEGALKKFSIPSFGRDIDDEFDLEGVGNTTALSFYLDNEDYQDIDKWPLKFFFYKDLKAQSVELEMNLSLSPCFLSTPKKIITEKKAEAKVKPKRTRKPKEEISDEPKLQSNTEQLEHTSDVCEQDSEPT